MTTRDMLPAIGREVDLRVESLWIRARVLDTKFAWGSPRLLVTPIAGTGEQWVMPDRVRLVEERKEVSA